MLHMTRGFIHAIRRTADRFTSEDAFKGMESYELKLGHFERTLKELKKITDTWADIADNWTDIMKNAKRIIEDLAAVGIVAGCIIKTVAPALTTAVHAIIKL